ncbi:glycosyltransferase [Chlamydiales bacterium]|nr:glycosyltransferase [Chlamydiales bacterium]
MHKYFLFLSLLLLGFNIQADSQKSTICLNMIVKNESEAIQACLDSTKNLIDYWVIFDTGSTDGTQSIIRECLKDIPGELHESPWVNFAHNRNEALKKATGKADYILFIDADEVLDYSDSFSLPPLNKDSYDFIIRQENAVDFRRIALIKSGLDWWWEGVLHETILSTQATSRVILDGVTNLCNTLKGARSKDPLKSLKDALVLEEALKNEPQNSRYVYYLAQSYFAAGIYELALKNYEKRCLMESADMHETYMAMYNVGRVYTKMENYENAIEAYFKAYKFYPNRAEPLSQIATIYRKQGNLLLGYLLSKHALTIPYPEKDHCVEYMTYDYGLLIEFSNCALLLGRLEEGLQACNQLLLNPRLPDEIRTQVIANHDFAQKHVK